MDKSIHVLGCGSIGLLFASSVIRRFPKQDISMLLRPHHRHRLNINDGCNDTPETIQCYLQSTYTTSTKYLNKCNPVNLPAEIIGERDDEIKNLLLCAKAHDCKHAVSSISNRILPISKIIILSNGALAIRDELKRFFPSNQIILASTTHGAYCLNETTNPDKDPSAFQVVHAGNGDTFIEDEIISELLNSAGLNSFYVSESQMNIMLWKKLAANCAINCITSLHNIPNGELDQLKYQKIIEEIIQEVSAVAIAENIELSDALNFEKLNDFVYDVIRRTSKNKSSMLQDILAKRKETEINYLNGYIVHLAQQHGMPAPQNKKMCSKIFDLCASNK